MAEQTTVVVTAEHTALAATLYDGCEELALERAEPDFVPAVAEQVACFHHSVGYLPRCYQELDAWSNDEAEWAAYQAAHPVTPCEECGGKGGVEGKQCEGCGAASTEPVPTVARAAGGGRAGGEGGGGRGGCAGAAEGVRQAVPPGR